MLKNKYAERNNENDIPNNNLKNIVEKEYPVPIGQRVYTDNGEACKEMTFTEHFLALISLGIYTSWIYTLFILLCFSWYPPVFILIILLISTLFLPAPLFWETFLKLDIFRLWRKYFKFSYMIEEKLDPDTSYLFAEFPHGTFPLGPFLAATLIPTMFPGKKILSLAATILFRIPIYRHIMCWLGCQPADRKNLERMILQSSVAVVVGGIAEMFMQYEDREQVLIKSRKGFIRLAVEHGVDIVPVYHFGNSRIMTIGPKFLIEYCRKMRMSFGILVGRWKLPIPKQHPIFMVVGRAVSVGNALQPGSDEYTRKVDEVHAKVIEEIRRIYNGNKAKFNWEGRPLEIV